MEYTDELNDFYELRNKAWGGAISRLDAISRNGKENELMDYLEEVFADRTPRLVEINDFLWFGEDDDEYYRSLVNGGETIEDVEAIIRRSENANEAEREIERLNDRGELNARWIDSAIDDVYYRYEIEETAELLKDEESDDVANYDAELAHEDCDIFAYNDSGDEVHALCTKELLLEHYRHSYELHGGER